MSDDRRLLLVEDSPEDERLLRHHLGPGFLIRRVDDRASLAGALGEPWDLVITDYLLPGLSGDQVLDLVRGRDPQLPIIVVSGRAGEDLAVELMRRGASDYILKENLGRLPFAVDRVLGEVKTKSARSRAEAQVVRLGRMYRLLSQTNQAIVRHDQPQDLLDEVCRLAARTGPFRRVRVVRPGTPPRVSSWAGPEPGEPESLDAEVLASGRAFRSPEGDRLVVPLKVEGAVWGTLGFEGPGDHGFPAEETTLLNDLAEDVSFGLEARLREQRRRESDQLLSEMAGLVPGMFFKLRYHPAEGFGFQYVSPGIDLILPYSAARVLADMTLVTRALHPSDRRKFIAAGVRSFRQLTVFNLEFRLVRPDGTVVWVLGTAYPQRHDDEVVWTGVALDVTPQNDLQQTLNRERLLQATILRAMDDGVVALDGAGRVVLVNPKALALLGQSRPPAPGTRAQDWWPDLPGEGNPGPVRFRRTTADGIELHLEMAVSPFGLGPRGDRGTLILIRDWTDRDRIEERLRQSEKLESIGLLAGGIAHDFNNLLTGLYGWVQLAQRAVDDPAKTAGYLEQVRGPFQRARTLTQQLLTFARGGQATRAPVDLGPLVAEVARGAVANRPVTLGLPGPGAYWIDANESQARQVFENLVLNAVQALGPGGGELTIELKECPAPGPEGRGLAPRAYVEAVVADDGPGIDPEALPRVFDPFFSTKDTGTGMGLSVCYSVVKGHGGLIEVESSPGEGARFRLFWPAPGPGATGG